MNSVNKIYHLFEVAWLGLEYMIVDKSNLSVSPIADNLLRDVSGEDAALYKTGKIEWLNKMALHNIELRTLSPPQKLNNLEGDFYRSIKRMNKMLMDYNACLLGTGAHPMMNPDSETKLWPHENSDIYESYHKIFNCHKHGFSNSNTINLQLPFNGDNEFKCLHAAIRVILPILPAIAASSPFLKGKYTGVLDSRFKESNSAMKKIPLCTASVIPEPIFSEDEYIIKILEPLRKVIQEKPFNKSLKPEVLNARGAIPHFDKGTIEIKMMDSQESPLADVAMSAFVIALLNKLVHETWSDVSDQQKISTNSLKSLMDASARDGLMAIIKDDKFLKLFNIKQSKLSMHVLVKILFERTSHMLSAEHQQVIRKMITKSNLSSRIMGFCRTHVDKHKIIACYQKLRHCLEDNNIFD